MDQDLSSESCACPVRDAHRPHTAGYPASAEPDPTLSSFADLAFYRQTLSLPWSRAGDRLIVAAADLGAANIVRLRARYGRGVRLRPVPRPVFRAALQSRFSRALLDLAANDLASRHPELSARRVMTPGQGIVLGAAALAVALALRAFPAAAGLALALTLGGAFVGNGLFRILLVWMGAEPKACVAPAANPDTSLPDYAIVVPLYREAEVVSDLIAAVSALDYPSSRLEIMLVVEADDADTIAAIGTQPLDARFTVVTVPAGLPRTKPKAANYALALVSSEFTVIYDAEDRPEPDQLRKAVAAFRAHPRQVACLQARLNFFNARECWLTSMFALDYSLWFDFLLPGLDRLRIPMPLGRHVQPFPDRSPARNFRLGSLQRHRGRRSGNPPGAPWPARGHIRFHDLRGSARRVWKLAGSALALDEGLYADLARAYAQSRSPA